MLKVNTQKISVEDFAKKYGMRPLYCLNTLLGYKKKYRYESVMSINAGGVVIIYNSSDSPVEYKCLEELLDMISSGDVIKSKTDAEN